MALDFIAGMVGGAAGVVVGHPFDTVKVRLQTQSNGRYKGTLDCFRQIIAKETASGLYKGISSPLGGLAFINAIVFGVHGNAIRILSSTDHNSMPNHIVAGACAGFAQSFVCSPMELAKLRIQLQGQGARHLAYPGSRRTNAYLGAFDCLRKTYGADGLRGVFKGLSLNIYRDVSGFALYFACYEYITRWMSGGEKKQLNAPQLLLAGGLSGSFSWFFNYPIDVVKSRYQADGALGQYAKYRNIRDCIAKSYRLEGVKVFSQGLCSTLIRAFPTNAITFFTVAMVYRLYARLSQFQGVSDGSEYQYFYAHVMEAGGTYLEPMCFIDSEVRSWRAFQG